MRAGAILTGLESDLPDWKDEGAYRSLLAAETGALAWEWLRRSDAYRRAARRSKPGSSEQIDALAFGLHRFEDPEISIPEARPIWTAVRMPSVIAATALPASGGMDSFSLAPLMQFATVARSTSFEHLLLSNGFTMHRLDIAGASLWSGPVTLRYEVSGLFAARASIAALTAFLRIAQKGRFQQRRPSSKMERQILFLRARDALAVGASQREIAAILLSEEATQDCWRINHSSLRSKVQRLCKTAGAMAAGGFWHLLNSGGRLEKMQECPTRPHGAGKVRPKNPAVAVSAATQDCHLRNP